MLFRSVSIQYRQVFPIPSEDRPEFGQDTVFLFEEDARLRGRYLSDCVEAHLDLLQILLQRKGQGNEGDQGSLERIKERFELSGEAEVDDTAWGHQGRRDDELAYQELPRPDGRLTFEPLQ